MAVNSAPTSVEVLRRLPHDGLRRELVRGELRVITPAGFEHGRVAANVGMLLGVHVRETESGVTLGAETGFILSRDPDTVRAPDAAFISRRRAEAVGTTDAYWPGAPDLAVEVVSPDDSFGEVEEKALDWLAAGTTAVLVLDPGRRAATVYRMGGQAQVHPHEDTLDLSDAVPQWRIAIADLFA